MIPRWFSHQAGRFLCLTSPVLGLALTVAACDKVPLTAPTASTITLFATGASVPSTGSVDIVASVIESAGTPVQNGTVVTFTTTLGTIAPSEARTNSGKVTVRLSSDGRSGTASIVAFSGGNKSEALTIPIGAAAADNIVLLASPSSVPAGGGTIQLTAQVRDASGNFLPNVSVTFTTTAGSLSLGSVSTDSNGQATTNLTTTRDADVTARAGSKEATVNVKVTTAPTVSASVSPASPTAGQPAVFAITVTPAANGSPVASVSIDFGDGATQRLGTGSTSVSHRYAGAGTYTVTVRVRDTAGQESSQVLVIIVLPRPPLPVNLDASPTSPKVGDVVTFFATATPATGVSVVSYEWHFGDGSTTETTGNKITHIFDVVATRTVSVTVTGSDGSTGVAQVELNIQP